MIARPGWNREPQNGHGETMAVSDLDERIDEGLSRQRKEARERKLEVAWMIVMLTAAVVIAVASIAACVALSNIAAENQRANALTWAAHNKEIADGGK